MCLGLRSKLWIRVFVSILECKLQNVNRWCLFAETAVLLWRPSISGRLLRSLATDLWFRSHFWRSAPFSAVSTSAIIMHMTFWFSSDLGNFLFDGFEVNTTRAFVATCFGLGAMAILLEFLKFWRMAAKHKSAINRNSTAPNGGSETSALLSGLHLRSKVERALQITFEIFLYFTQETFNWIVMLAVMGYNGYIFLSVLVGAGLGYALFGESIAHAKIQNVKMRAAMISCGDCQVKDEANENSPGQSDPPTESIPTISGSLSTSITVHSGA